MQVFWVHPASGTFRRDEPDRLLETIWIAHPGWGYVRRKDLWIRIECALEELRSQGYVELTPLDDGEVRVCPYCHMYIISIPGSLVKKHIQACGGAGEDWLAIENEVISNKRMKDHEARLQAAAEREKAEREAAEKRERFDRIREDALKQQLAKDKKRRLREETKEEWKRR